MPLAADSVPARAASACASALTVSILTLVAALAFGAAPAAAMPAPTPGAAAPSKSDTRLSSPALLARPTNGVVYKGRNMKWSGREARISPKCSQSVPVCVHWTATGGSAPPNGDRDGDNVPNQVEATLAAAVTSWKVIVKQLNFRAPLPDGRSRYDGGNQKFDIYLANTGSKEVAGYVASDDPRLRAKSDYRYRDVSAFMVVDNDFNAKQFPQGTSEGQLRTTVAHELFHAVQFAYDHAEDLWFSEGTATWVEDRVFDGPNLNRRSLRSSPLVYANVPLDTGRNGHQYGSWIFFRYLAEKFGTDVIRSVWRQADDSKQEVSRRATDTYSLMAVRRALKQEGHDFNKVFAAFTRDNLSPGRTYSEGSSYPKPFSPRIVLNQRGEDTHWMGVPIDHLAASYLTLVPGENAPGAGKAKIRFNGPPRRTAPQAQVVVHFRSGASNEMGVRLNRKGSGAISVAFGRRKVDSVDIAMVNSSTRFRGCFQQKTAFSCRGHARDDDRNFAVRAWLPR